MSSRKPVLRGDGTEDGGEGDGLELEGEEEQGEQGGEGGFAAGEEREVLS